MAADALCQDISSHVIYYTSINHNHIYVMAAHNQGSSYSKIFTFPTYKILHFSIHFRYHLEENFTKNTCPTGRFICPRCHWAMVCHLTSRFTCPGPSGIGICQALHNMYMLDNVQAMSWLFVSCGYNNNTLMYRPLLLSLVYSNVYSIQYIP